MTTTFDDLLARVDAGSRLGEAVLRLGAGRGHRALSILLLCTVAVTSAVQAVSDLLGHPL